MRKAIRAAAAVLIGSCMLVVAGCGGGGGGGGETDAASAAVAAPSQPATPAAAPAEAPVVAAPSTPAAPAAPAGRLFIGDWGHPVIGALPLPVAKAELSAVDLLPAAWPVTRLAYDAKRDILYADLKGGASAAIMAFPNASRMTTASSPSRTIALPGDANTVVALQIDTERDVLYVGASRTYDGQMHVFNNASQIGSVAPTRTLTLRDGRRGMVVDTARSILYTLGGQGVDVYTGIDTASGAITATRVLEPSGGFQPGALALDAGRDRLYFADVFTGISVIDGASKPAAKVGTTLPMQHAGVIAVDPAADRLYVGAYDKAYILDRASSLASGAMPALTITAPSGTAISSFALP
jgi:hypothetical protein